MMSYKPRTIWTLMITMICDFHLIVNRGGSDNKRLLILLFKCFFGFAEVAHAHAGQHMIGLTELDAGVADNLDAIAPRIKEVEERAGENSSQTRLRFGRSKESRAG